MIVDFIALKFCGWRVNVN